MILIGYYKGRPANYIIKFTDGKIKREGRGISFFYSKRKTSVISVPTGTRDAFFVFNETTRSFQSVSIQGQLTYKIIDYKKISELLDFTVDAMTNNYLTKDNEQLSQRIINAVQMATRNEIKDLTLEETLSGSRGIAEKVMGSIKNNPELIDTGVQCLSLYFTAITPTPEIAKALEADYREMLQKKADEAIYSRRAAAVEQERIIKENELNSQIEIEKKKQELVDLEGNNTLKKAAFSSKAISMELEQYGKIDPRTVLALGFNKLAKDAKKIGNLTITSELLASILNAGDK